MKLSQFAGINNVTPAHRLADAELDHALNVNIGTSGDVWRRDGVELLDDTTPIDDVWRRPGCVLLVSGENLDAMSHDAAFRATLLSSPEIALGRMWFCDMPDGRTAFSNGHVSGITDGVTVTSWGVPSPLSAGAASAVTGLMDSGSVRYMVTFVRLSDGREGAPAYGDAVDVDDGGILVTGLPMLDGHRVNIYITGVDGDKAFYAGTTITDSFAYLGKTDALAMPCRTEHTSPTPIGTICAAWRGRMLVAVGPTLFASLPHNPEGFDLRRDFKQLTAPITMIQPVDDGVWIGTTENLAFLAGGELDSLVLIEKGIGGVTLGSGVAVPGEYIAQGQGSGQGSAMICIAGGVIVAGFNGGMLSVMTRDRYATKATEVAASFRIDGGAPQYIAIPK